MAPALGSGWRSPGSKGEDAGSKKKATVGSKWLQSIQAELDEITLLTSGRKTGSARRRSPSSENKRDVRRSPSPVNGVASAAVAAAQNYVERAQRSGARSDSPSSRSKQRLP